MGGDNSTLISLSVIGGPILLVLLIAYGLFTRRRLSAGEKQAQRQGTERAYRDDPKT